MCLREFEKKKSIIIILKHKSDPKIYTQNDSPCIIIIFFLSLINWLKWNNNWKFSVLYQPTHFYLSLEAWVPPTDCNGLVRENGLILQSISKRDMLLTKPKFVHNSSITPSPFFYFFFVPKNTIVLSFKCWDIEFYLKLLNYWTITVFIYKLNSIFFWISFLRIIFT